MKRWPLVGGVALTAASLAGAAGGCRRATPSPAGGERDRVRVSYAPFVSYAPLFIAADAGLFRAHGLDVELVRMPVYDSTAALLHGDVDVASNYLSIGALNAIAKGERLRIVADKGYEATGGCAANALFARRALVTGGQLSGVASLRGRRVAVQSGTVEEFWFDRMLERAGVPRADVNVVTLLSEGRAAALGTGAVDLVAWSEPFLSQAAAEGLGAVWKGAGEVIPDLQWAYVLYGRSLLDARPDVGRRFTLAYLEGVRTYLEGKTEGNVASIVRHTGLDPDVVRRGCWLAVRPDGRIDTASVLDFERWAKLKGYLDAIVPEERFWDPSFVAWASPRLGGGR